MPIARSDESHLVLIDLQPSFMKGIHNAESVIRRAQFLTEVAVLLDVPLTMTEQNVARMGGTDSRLTSLIPAGSAAPVPKMSFGCCGVPTFDAALETRSAKQVVLVGVETHICVLQTALALVEKGREVFVVGEAVSARTEWAHSMGIERMQQAGVSIAHSESIAYEWMRSAEHPSFRKVLDVVKRFSEMSP